MGVASSLGLASGINYEELVSKLISLERRPITILESRKTGIEEKIGALDALSIKLSSLKSAARSLNNVNMFNTRSVEVTSSGTEAYLTATASPSAAVGSYNIYVDQLAQAHKIASQGWADETATPVLDSASYPSGGNFSFRIGDSGAITDINITASTTLQEMKDMINAANAGVNAIILNDGTDINSYRMVLTSENTGEHRSSHVRHY